MTDNLSPIDPESAVDAICRKIAAMGLSYVTRLEMEAFRDTRTRHDGQRLANALRHAEKHTDLADELEALIGGRNE